ncbi:DUF423 domain-containing protein [Methylobacterium iners]|uniref:DUF423 domain-containing protein n=1 Tax=Methylobacterium iners TaxID=418707 RepID=A0ABQ4S2X5_9HYPH|nr:DUF423 domain-containing protein [Methylobacterium iners]GJD96045.1 hypothetical protein OCOJLMKI_3263 [Methylobacterium iners]
MSGPDRALAALAALAGLLGVAGSAAAAHTSGGETLRTAAQFLLFHAPAILTLTGFAAAGLTRGGPTRVAAAALVLGLTLFSGDLAMRVLAETPLFPMAAPTGGIVLIAAWLAVAVVACLPVRR